MNILIAGDFCPWDRVARAMEYRDLSCFDSIKHVIQAADYAIVNLECPIAEPGMNPIEKSGPNLCTNKIAIDVIKDAGFSAVTLANNHFRDYGNEGCENTIRLLNEYGIDYVGGGDNMEQASAILYKQLGNHKIAIINCCENECSIVSDTQAGSNPINPIQQFYKIKEAKLNADIVLVIVHGGVEHYQYPTPRMKELYHFYVDIGADAVINHHQHCYSGYEVYNEKPIFYGLGNFCFDMPEHRNDKYNQGFMVVLNTSNILSFDLCPYIQCDEKPIVCPMNETESHQFENNILHINEIIANNLLLQEEYKKLIADTSKLYKLYVEPYSSRIMKFLYKHNILPNLMRDKYSVLANVIRCESHRERILAALT